MHFYSTPESKILVLEAKDCTQCRYQEPQGTVATVLDCPSCKGTGRGPRGGARGCKGGCHGSGRFYDHDTRATCPSCSGSYAGATTEGRCDYAPVETLADVDLQIVYVDRPGTWNEAYLGLGSLLSVTDYGRTFDDRLMGAERLAEKVRDDHLSQPVQAIKIAPFPNGAVEGDSAPVADTIAVIVHRNGYVLVPFLNGEALR